MAKTFSAAISTNSMQGWVRSLRFTIGFISPIALTTIRPDRESVSAIIRTAQAMIRNNGSVRVSELAHRTGFGLRQFERRFGQEIGISPKLFARIVRFEAALQRRAIEPPPDGPILRMTWAITIKCTWCTISRDCPGTVRT